MPSDRGPRDVIDVLTRDHRRVEDMFVRVTALSPGDRRRRYVVARVITELMRHALAEERYLYPAIREHVPDGERLAAEKVADHAVTRRTIEELDGLDPSDARFDDVFRRLVGTAHEHLEDEETNLFPKLVGACEAGVLHELGTKIEDVKRVTPVWPYDGAPDAPSLDGWPGSGSGSGPGPGRGGWLGSWPGPLGG